MSKLQSVDGLLFDLDGVLYVSNMPIEGARKVIAELGRRGIPRRYLTNTTTKSIASLHRKLADMGFVIDAREIISAPYATVLYLRQQEDPSCYLLLADEVKRDFAEFRQTETKPNFVIIGDIGDAWSYPLLNRVFDMLINGSRLIAMHKGKFWQTESGLQLDIGAFVVGLEYASGQEALLIGKPSVSFFQLALQDLKVPAEKAAIVGDDIDSDIGGGQAAGLTGILVKTGKYRAEYVATSSIKPDLLLESVCEPPIICDQIHYYAVQD